MVGSFIAPKFFLVLTCVLAYDEVMKWLCIAATIFAIPPLLISLFMPNWYLGDAQNAVEGVDLAGQAVNEATGETKNVPVVNEKA